MLSKYMSWGLALVLSVSAAVADEDALYDKPLSDDAGFVRFLGFDGDLPPVFDQSLSSETLAAGDYGVISADQSPLAERGQFYTVIPDAEGSPQVLTEPARDRAKVLIQLLNLTEAEISLKLADGSVAVVEGVAPGQIGGRLVNPVKAPLQVFQGDTPLGEVSQMVLQRGSDPTFVADMNGVQVLVSQIKRTDLGE